MNVGTPAMPSTARDDLAAMLDVLVYENVLLLWSHGPHDTYVLVSHDGDTMNLTEDQAGMWALGAFAVFLAFVDQGRITPRMPGR
ncbi:hypothetical protein [Thermoactinospora rubra]|uniref:hypothetical protein n=1 Tax=Thermoactinospora rubra TaxID=1088767 RepID=UPI00117FCDE4|nr:hypothetical protein [Thermoactinospora rubra]